MIREANKVDIKDCSKLIHISGAHLFCYLYNLDVPDIYTLLETMCEAGDTTYSYKNALLEVLL